MLITHVVLTVVTVLSGNSDERTVVGVMDEDTIVSVGRAVVGAMDECTVVGVGRASSSLLSKSSTTTGSAMALSLQSCGLA